jgi:hypothetical protein
MPNGVAVALQSIHAEATAYESPSTKLIEVGEAVADAAILVGAGLADFDAVGGLLPATRTRAGDVFMRLYELSQNGGIDFVAAQAEGKRVLLLRYGRALTQHYGLPVTALDPIIDEIISWPLDILRKMIAVERAWAN